MPKVIKHAQQINSAGVVVISENVKMAEEQSDYEQDCDSGLSEENVRKTQKNSKFVEIESEGHVIMVPKNEADDAAELAKKIIYAARIEHDKIIRGAKEQAFEIKNQAKKQGYEEAQEEVKKSISECINEINSLMAELQERQDCYFKQYENELQKLSISIAEKILHKTILSGGSEIEELIKFAISSVKGADWISVELSDKLIMLISQLKRDFSAKERHSRIEFVEKNMPVDHVIVKTSEGVIDASVPVQIQNLKDIFEDMNKEQ